MDGAVTALAGSAAKSPKALTGDVTVQEIPSESYTSMTSFKAPPIGVTFSNKMSLDVNKRSR